MEKKQKRKAFIIGSCKEKYLYYDSTYGKREI